MVGFPTKRNTSGMLFAIQKVLDSRTKDVLVCWYEFVGLVPAGIKTFAG